MRNSKLRSVAGLAIASLVWAWSPALAQKIPPANEAEFAAKWEAANPRFLKGRDFFIKKDFDRAEAEFRACLNIFPEHADALFFLAQLDSLRGDFVQALGHIEKAEAGHAAFNASDGVRGAQRRTSLLEERKKKEEAVASMEEIFYAGTCSTDDEMLKIPESIESLRREISAINARLKELDKTDPATCPADYSYVHGNILFKLKRSREAASQYLHAIDADAGHSGAYNNLINLFYMAKDYGNALKFIEQAEANGVALNPKLKNAVVQLAKK